MLKFSGTDGLTMYSQIATEGKAPEAEVETLELQEIVQTGNFATS